MIETFKKISFIMVLITMAVMFIFLLTDAPYAMISVNIFLVIWSLDKVFLCYFNFDFGIASQLKIKKDAPKLLRLLGLIFVLFVLYIGAKGILEAFAT